MTAFARRPDWGHSCMVPGCNQARTRHLGSGLGNAPAFSTVRTNLGGSRQYLRRMCGKFPGILTACVGFVLDKLRWCFDVYQAQWPVARQTQPQAPFPYLHATTSSSNTTVKEWRKGKKKGGCVHICEHHGSLCPWRGSPAEPSLPEAFQQLRPCHPAASLAACLTQAAGRYVQAGWLRSLVSVQSEVQGQKGQRCVDI
eukprot:366557-Chlamydomonas_euryale.AAC.11